MTDKEFERLVTLYLEDAIGDEELQTLNDELIRSSHRVHQFNDLRLLNGLIHEHAHPPESPLSLAERTANRDDDAAAPRTATTLRSRIPTLIAGLAASLALAITLAPYMLQAEPVATLVSSENAAWESSLPTTPGSTLMPGALRLKNGIATVQFRSGVDVILEAPSELELLDSMRGRILSGKATIDVPESAIGFVMETPDGYVIDRGTEFSVSVDDQGRNSSFEVIEGEISVHLPSETSETLLRGEGQIAQIIDGSIVTSDSREPLPPSPPSAKLLRVGVDDRAGTAVRNDRREFINSKFLTVNRLHNLSWERRSFFAIDVTAVEMDSVKSVSLQLNLVPFRRGFFSHLPLKSSYEVYGLTNSEKANWETECRWQDSPGPDDGVLLGTFEIPRTQERGSFAIENEALLQFLRKHKSDDVTFIVVRDSLPIRRGQVPSHAFAGVDHPEANAPYLEFTIAE